MKSSPRRWRDYSRRNLLSLSKFLNLPSHQLILVFIILEHEQADGSFFHWTTLFNRIRAPNHRGAKAHHQSLVCTWNLRILRIGVAMWG